MGDFGYVSLMDDGSVKYTGYNTSSAYANIPEALSGDVVDIAGTSGTFVGIKSDGSSRISRATSPTTKTRRPNTRAR